MVVADLVRRQTNEVACWGCGLWIESVLGLGEFCKSVVYIKKEVILGIKM